GRVAEPGAAVGAVASSPVGLVGRGSAREKRERTGAPATVTRPHRAPRTPVVTERALRLARVVEAEQVVQEEMAVQEPFRPVQRWRWVALGERPLIMVPDRL